MDINLKNVENYYNGDDWRLFNHKDFNTVNTLDIKQQDVSDNDRLDQIDFYVQKIKNRPY
jgi:hypothetical protein